MTKKDEKAMDRRDFFRKAGLGAGVAGVAAASLTKGATAAVPETRSASSVGYRETDHVKKFYELARF
ncbi:MULTISPECIES: formate dehydrogenase [Limibacillus]|jgi:hypothetical protein|uniref:Formate dehydrogenase region TAT target n=1 Tax=Limibacillus halophilus TaxID=1579333 RepID=A0A839SSC4_9PROT|nr:formate dehydrogenase [Limibacillus halophilus]MBB3064684.1 hypothetical protein [Limibacillus halophilus]